MNPFMLSSYHTDQMTLDMGKTFPQPSVIEGHIKKPGKGIFVREVILIHAELYYQYLIEHGFAAVLRQHYIFNYEQLVAQYGAWKRVK